MAHITLDPGEIQTVQIRTLGLMERRRLLSSQVARLIGRDPSTLSKFLTGADPSSAVAVDLMREFPEVSAGIVCPTCGRPMNKLDRVGA